MVFDFKKECKELYNPKNRPEILIVPKMNYIAIRGNGNPNDKNGEYKNAISVLYSIAYALKMSYKTDYKIDGFFEYVVPHLEGFWWQDGDNVINYSNKSKFNWISVIRLPDFVTEENFKWAVNVVSKKKIDCSLAEFLTVNEGLCVQIMHIGSYDNEHKTIEIMESFLQENGYINDINGNRLHHEIYLSDPRKTNSDKLKTIIRHPIKKI